MLKNIETMIKCKHISDTTKVLLVQGDGKMKLGKTLLIGLATIGLVACSASERRGTEVKKDEFIAEAQKVEETANYTKATLTYSINTRAKGYEGGNKSQKGTIKYTYSEGGFSMDAGQKVDEDVLGYVDGVVGGKIQDAVIELDVAPAGYVFKFFKAPLGFEMSLVNNDDVEGLKGSSEIKAYTEFNNYGFVVKEIMETKTAYSGEVSGVKVSYSTSSKVSVTVSYQ